jgi:hypothetical protein
MKWFAQGEDVLTEMVYLFEAGYRRGGWISSLGSLLALPTGDQLATNIGVTARCTQLRPTFLFSFIWRGAENMISDSLTGMRKCRK